MIIPGYDKTWEAGKNVSQLKMMFKPMRFHLIFELTNHR